MELDGPELRALATFYARRFPKKADRLRIAHAAGITEGWTDAGDPEAAWESIIRKAQADERLHDLAEAARNERPKDENLGELARSLRASARPMSLLWLLVTGVCTGVGGYLVGYDAGTKEVRPAPLMGTEVGTQMGTAAVDQRGIPATEEEVADDEGAADDAADAAEGAPANADAPPEGEGTAMPEATPRDPNEPLPVDAPTAEDLAAVATLPVVDPYVAGSALPEGCRGPVGAVVGYWFAGDEAPGRVGTTVTMDKAIRVRADYPRRENDFNASTAERCVLRPGMRVRISQEPKVVEEGGIWVPLVPEDVR